MPNKPDVESAIPLKQFTSLNQDKAKNFQWLFDQADTNRDGSISYPELLTTIENNNVKITPKILNHIIHQYDMNRDGELNFTEFYSMLNTPKYRPFFATHLNNYVRFIVPNARNKALNSAEIAIDGGEYEEEYTCRPPALGMILISLVQIGCFVYDVVVKPGSTLNGSGPCALILHFDPHKKVEAWRYLTYMFVHIGYSHLVMNLCVQILIGIPLEMVHGWRRVLPVYVSSGVFGSLATTITDPWIKLAGASGGVYSLLTAHIATIILNWNEMMMPFVQLVFFLLLIGVDLGSAVYDRYKGELDHSIGYTAHLAGATAGLLVGITVLRNLKWTWKENILWWIAIIVFFALFGIAVVCNVFGVTIKFY